MVANASEALDYSEAIFRALRRIIRAVDLYNRRLVHRHTLTGPQLVCLRRIHKFGPMTSGALAKEVSLSPATVTGICDRLESRNLVTRTRRPEDKRQVLITLTDAGREHAESSPLPLQDSFLRRLLALPEAQQAEIASVLERIVAMMEADDELGSEPLPDSASLGGLSALSELMPAPHRRRKDADEAQD